MSDTDSSDTSYDDSDASEQFAWERNDDEDESDYDSEDEYHTYDSAEDDDDDEDDDSYSSEASSEDQVATDQNILFISTYQNEIHNNSIVVSYAKELSNYRKKISELPKKNVKEMNKLWDGIKVRVENSHDLPIFMYEDKIKETISGKKNETTDQNQKNKLVNKNEESKQASTNKKPPTQNSSKNSTNAKTKNAPRLLCEFDSVDSTENMTFSPHDIEQISCAGAKIFINPNAGEILKNLAKNMKSTTTETIKLKKPTSNPVKTKPNSSKEKPQKIPQLNASIAKSSPAVIEKSKINEKKSNEVLNVNTKSKSINEEKSKKNNSKLNSNGATKKNENVMSNSKNMNKNNETKKNNVKIESSDNLKSASNNDTKGKENDKNKTNVVHQTKKNDNIPVKTSQISESSENTKKINEIEKNKTYVALEPKKNDDMKFEVVSRKVKRNLKKQQKREKKLKFVKRDLSSASSKLSESSNKTSISYDNDEKSEESKPKTNNKKGNESAKEKKSIQNSDKDKVADMLSDDEDMKSMTQVPTFIAETIKHKEKNKSNNKTVLQTSKTSKKKTDDNKEEFVLHTKKRREPLKCDQEKIPIDKNSLPDSAQIYYSQKFAEDAVDMALVDNNLLGALDSINEAISFNPLDHRHYLNRSYLYLRMSRPALALADAQYVISATSHIGHSFMANLRAGQASFALRKYLEAEMYFKEAVSRNPDSLHAPRELLRAQTAYIVSMGFKEKDSISALEKYIDKTDSVKHAVNFLKENNLSVNAEVKNDNDFLINGYKNVIYKSEDEDDEPSTIKILNKILNYFPGQNKMVHLIAKPAHQGSSANIKFDKKSLSKIVIDPKKVTTVQDYKTKAIWVGSLTKEISDELLKKKFKQFGNIVSIYRPANENYAFINFEKNEDVNNILKNSASYEVAGTKLPVRPAVRQK